MSAEPLPAPDPVSVFESGWYRLVLLFFAVYLAVLWFVLGPGSPWYAIGVAAGTFALGPIIASDAARDPCRRSRVPARERFLHRLLGVGMFGWLLDASGWNRRVANRMRRFSGKRGGLAALERGLFANASAHGKCFGIHLLLAAVALSGRDPLGGALWMLAPGVVLHLYPALLQRSIMLRLQPLMRR